MASVRIRRLVRRCERTTSYLITCISGASHTLAYPIIKWLAVLVRRLEAVAWKALMKLSVEGVESKWPWKTALGKFDSVTPGKKIWFVHPKKHLPSVLLLRLTQADSVNFKYRGASNDRVSVDFSAGDRFLSDIPVTASDYSKEPEVLNRRFVERAKSSHHWFLLGLARAERRGPDGYNRLDAWLWLVEDGYKFDGQFNCFAMYRVVGNGCIKFWVVEEECSEHQKRLLDVEALPEYCQIMLIGVLPGSQGGLRDPPDRFDHALAGGWTCGPKREALGSHALGSSLTSAGATTSLP